jgi:hypothetical protein
MAYTDIDKPEDYFNTKLYTGNGSTQSITGVGFQPDWIWIKRRDVSANHQIEDSVRGIGRHLHSNTSDVEAIDSTTITSLDSDGYTLGSNASVNGSTNTFVGWNWLAGGTASSNTDGSITSNVSANTTSGFSIVSYTGTGSVATVGHLLGAVPKIIFFKDRETSVDWGVYAEAIGNGNELYLSTNDSAGANSGAFNNTSPTSSVFTIGTSSRYNPSSKDVIAYCFAEKKGFSKFGSYTGNGYGSGAFVYTGFKPAFVIVKATSRTGVWGMHDNKRLGYNPDNKPLYAEQSIIEDSSNNIDLLSNGFKIRTNSGSYNEAGANYIYMAFASNPFVTSTGIPTTAR